LNLKNTKHQITNNNQFSNSNDPNGFVLVINYWNLGFKLLLFGKGIQIMKIVSIAISKKKGTRKTPVDEAFISKDHGLEGDAHAGKWHRQVSFLSSESIAGAKEQGLDVTFGDFAENIASEGIDWKTLPVGTQVRLGDTVLVEITQIGKECHNKCAIYYKAGDCIMPREGVFARVLEEGKIRRGDEIKILHP
jgi:MOSC domain-containing protein YiiM